VLDSGETQKEVIRPDFNRAIMIDFLGATISSDTGFILFREIDERFRIIDPMKDCLQDSRSPAHTKHALVQLVRQRVYQIAAGYEDCNDADFLRIDPALRLAIGKDHKVGASQSMLSRLENNVLGNSVGLEALDAAITRSTDTLLKGRTKSGLLSTWIPPRTQPTASRKGLPTMAILPRTVSIRFFALPARAIV